MGFDATVKDNYITFFSLFSMSVTIFVKMSFEVFFKSFIQKAQLEPLPNK